MQKRNDLSVLVEQKQVLSVKTMQLLSLLQKNSAELAEYLERAVSENPVMELVRPSDDVPAGLFFREIQSIPIRNRSLSFSVEDTGAVDPAFEDLASFLKDQLYRRRPSDPELEALCRILIDHIGEDGFLSREDWNDIAAGAEKERAEEALALIQTMDPPGVGARNYRESFLLQLKRMDGAELAELIIREHLEALGRKDYARIAEQTGTEVADVAEAAEQIRSLNVRPVMDAPARQVEYIRPDAEIEILPDGEMELHLNLAGNDQIAIDPYYEDLARQSTEETTREYLRARLQEARWLKKSLWQRTVTFQKCVLAVVSGQSAYLTKKTSYLEPLTMKDIAETVGLHPSTVSRSLRGAHLLWNGRVIAVKSLLTRSTGKTTAGKASSDRIKNELAGIIRKEEKPLSDRELADILESRGLSISRRTVAKYRTELGIPDRFHR